MSEALALCNFVSLLCLLYCSDAAAYAASVLVFVLFFPKGRETIIHTDCLTFNFVSLLSKDITYIVQILAAYAAFVLVFMFIS